MCDHDNLKAQPMAYLFDHSASPHQQITLADKLHRFIQHKYISTLGVLKMPEYHPEGKTDQVNDAPTQFILGFILILTFNYNGFALKLIPLLLEDEFELKRAFLKDGSNSRGNKRLHLDLKVLLGLFGNLSKYPPCLGIFFN